jgi:hypothetical protein
MQKKIKKVKAAKKKMRGGGIVKAAKKKMQSGGTVALSDKTLRKAESSIIKGKPKLTEKQKTVVFNRELKSLREESRNRENFKNKILEDFAKRVDEYNKKHPPMMPTDYLKFVSPKLRKKFEDSLTKPAVSKKKKPPQQMMRGGAVKKKMRGGGMVKAAKKKMMRGGMAKKKR